MGKSKPASDFSHIEDPELRKELEAVVARRQIATDKEIPPEAASFPRFVFSRATPIRDIGTRVMVRNGLDEEMKGGTIREKLGRAYRVELGGISLIVHEPDDSWE